MNGSWPAAGLALLLAATSAPATAQEQTPAPAGEPAPGEPDDLGEPRRPTPFDQFRWQFSFGLGGNLYGDSQYLAIGGSARFFVIDGLGVGLAVDQWIGPWPMLTKVSPEVRYVFWQLFPYSPYVGVFYRHWFIWNEDETIDGADTVGGRAGIIWSPWYSGGIGIGLAYEGVVSPCTQSCHYVLPEVTVGFGF